MYHYRGTPVPTDLCFLKKLAGSTAGFFFAQRATPNDNGVGRIESIEVNGSRRDSKPHRLLGHFGKQARQGGPLILSRFIGVRRCSNVRDENR